MKAAGIVIAIVSIAATAILVWLFHVVTFGEPNPAFMFESEPPEGYDYWSRLSEGAKSPDGMYEVRIARQNMNDQPTGYGVHIHSTKPEKRVFTLPEIGGYLEYEGAVERDHSYWHASSGFVAITDQASRHSRQLYIVAISNGSVVVLQQPDFY